MKVLQVQPGVNTLSHAFPMFLEVVSCSRISGNYLHVVQSPNQKQGPGDHAVLLR